MCYYEVYSQSILKLGMVYLKPYKEIVPYRYLMDFIDVTLRGSFPPSVYLSVQNLD